MPLRTQISGAPLEDARHLAHHYDKLRQDVEAQVLTDVKFRSKQWCMKLHIHNDNNIIR